MRATTRRFSQRARVAVVRSRQPSCGANQDDFRARILLAGALTTRGRPEMVPRGLEPRTLRLLAVRSNQLSYETE